MTAPTSVDLAALIEYVSVFKQPATLCPRQAERDEIVLALRVLRVLRSNPDIIAIPDEMRVVFIMDGIWHQLDAAERILGIGGGSGNQDRSNEAQASKGHRGGSREHGDVRSDGGRDDD